MNGTKDEGLKEEVEDVEWNRGGLIRSCRDEVGVGREGSLLDGTEEFVIGGKNEVVIGRFEVVIGRFEVMPEVMVERRGSNGDVLEPGERPVRVGEEIREDGGVGGRSSGWVVLGGVGS